MTARAAKSRAKRRIRILMIDDNADYTTLMSLYLAEMSGPSVSFFLEPVPSLKMGLEFLARKRFDLVLLDLMLPDSQGLDTLAALKPRSLGAPIVVMTNLDDEHVGLEAVARGATDFLSKGKLDARLIERAVGHALGEGGPKGPRPRRRS